jgi:hypothetical protein
MSAPPPGTVSLEDLSLEQISQVRTQLEQVRTVEYRSSRAGRSQLALTRLLRPDSHRRQELKHLTAAFGDLKQAQSKFMACMESLDAIKPANKGELSRLLPDLAPCGLGTLLHTRAYTGWSSLQTRRSSSRSRAPCTSPAG